MAEPPYIPKHVKPPKKKTKKGKSPFGKGNIGRTLGAALAPQTQPPATAGGVSPMDAGAGNMPMMGM